jgi:hypothetical protein
VGCIFPPLRGLTVNNAANLLLDLVAVICPCPKAFSLLASTVPIKFGSLSIASNAVRNNATASVR